MMEPEVAIFTDNESPLYWRLSSGAHYDKEDQTPNPGIHWPGSDPLSWNQLLLIDPILALGTLGAPIRHYSLSDLLLPPCAAQDKMGARTSAAGAGCIPLRHLRLAIFTQAQALSDVLVDAMHSKLAINNVTLTFLYAAGVVNRTSSTWLGEAGIQKTTGIANLRQGTGGPAQLNVTLEPNVVAGGKVTGSFGPEMSIEPWYYISERDKEEGDKKVDPPMMVMARFATPSKPPTSMSKSTLSAQTASLPTATLPKPIPSSAGLVAIARIQLPTHNVVFSATPSIPTPVWRQIATNAGVHLYTTMADKSQRGSGGGGGGGGTAVATSSNADALETDAIVEVAGSNSVYVAFANRVHWHPWLQRNLKIANDSGVANRVCNVQLKGVVESVRRYPDVDRGSKNSSGWMDARSGGTNLPTTVVCEECSTWQQPCNASVLYVLS